MNETQTKILDIGKQVREQLTSLRSYKEKLDDLQTLADSIKRDIMADILNAKDPESGKAVYSNDKLRDAEMSKRLGLNSQWVEYQETIGKLNKAISRAEDELKGLSYDMRGWEVIANLGALL